MLKCTIMNGFCGPLLLLTSLQVLAPSNLLLLLHSLTVASRRTHPGGRHGAAPICWWRDLKMLDDGFQHHVGGHDVQLSIIAMRYCYIDPRHHQIFFFFHSSHTDLKQHWLGPSSINVFVASSCLHTAGNHRDHVR